MPKFSDVKIADLYKDGTRSPVEIAAATIGLWLIRHGGNDKDARPSLLSVLSPSLTDHDLQTIDDAVRSHDEAGLQIACEIFASVSDYKMRLAFFHLLMDEALKDGYLSFFEQEFLLLLTDVLAVSELVFHKIFNEKTGTTFPPVPDVSSREWWQLREHGKEQSRHTKPQAPPHRRIHDLGILGLDESATSEAIHRAYLRLSQIHHPDKFHVLGEEAVKEAEKSFSMIKAAYDRLVRGA